MRKILEFNLLRLYFVFDLFSVGLRTLHNLKYQLFTA